jgi:hypothetical protein
MTNQTISSNDVAQWMYDKVKKKPIYQDEVVWKIRKKFGKNFAYDNVNGNLAIDKVVLKEFNKLSKTDVVWSKGERLWRMRTPDDKVGRSQY